MHDSLQSWAGRCMGVWSRAASVAGDGTPVSASMLADKVALWPSNMARTALLTSASGSTSASHVGALAGSFATAASLCVASSGVIARSAGSYACGHATGFRHQGHRAHAISFMSDSEKVQTICMAASSWQAHTCATQVEDGHTHIEAQRQHAGIFVPAHSSTAPACPEVSLPLLNAACVQ